MALMWFLRASRRVASQTTIFGVGWDVLNVLNHSERGQELGREDTWQEVMEQGPSCSLRGQGTSWGQAEEQDPTNHPVPSRLKTLKVSPRHAEGGKVQPLDPRNDG